MIASIIYWRLSEQNLIQIYSNLTLLLYDV